MAGKMSLRLKGDQQLMSKLNMIKLLAPQAIGAALYQEGQEIMADSKENYVPIDTGALRASGHVELPEIAKDHVTVTLGYGGAAGGEEAPYAVFVHEDLTAHHPVGSAKYLEQPLNEASKGMAKRLGAKAEAALRRAAK